MLIWKLENGHRLEKPQHCPDDMYDLMYKCWYSDKYKRPTFSEIVKEIKYLLTELHRG
jgi:hypothetical protein